MNGTPSNDKLSAWLDNELPLDERAEVEKLLAESPELRQEVEELRRLSGLLKGLPQEQAPVELQQAVMRSLERETLVAAGGSGSPFRTERVVRVLAAAAGIVLVAGLGLWVAGNNGQNVADNGNGSVQPEIVHVEQTRPEMRANKADLSQSTLTVELPTRQFEIDRNALDAADIGDIVQAVRRDGESVSVIRLTVVDRHAGLESLRVLLAHQDIPLDGSANTQPGSPTGATPDNGLVAVYVQSKSEQLSRAIEQMARRVEFDALSVSDALPIAGLDSGVRSELGLAGTDQGTAASRAVSVRSGSPLEKIIAEPGGYASSSEPAEASTTNDRPVRVIFVLTDAPSDARPADKAEGENGDA